VHTVDDPVGMSLMYCCAVMLTLTSSHSFHAVSAHSTYSAHSKHCTLHIPSPGNVMVSVGNCGSSTASVDALTLTPDGLSAMRQRKRKDHTRKMIRTIE
jgi:hypothetical protein